MIKYCPICNKNSNEVKFNGFKCKSCYNKDWWSKNPEKRKDYAQNRNPRDIYKIEYRFTHAKSTAKQRKKCWDLNLEQYSNFLKKKCYYCNKSLLNESGIGLDRIDNSKGYVFDNVLPCCGSCNQIRGDHLTVPEMKLIMKVLIKFRKQTITMEKI